MIPEIAVLAPHRHPRLRYTLAELGRELGWRFRLFTDEDKWRDSEGYAKLLLKENIGGVKCISFKLHQILSGVTATSTDLEASMVNSLPSFFRVEDDYDYLSCIFYVLSRYEEYDNESGRDKLGRFLAKNSHAQQNNYLHRPVVREWAAHLADRIRKVFPNLPQPTYPNFSFEPTYDIDILWAWKHRGLRGIGAGLRDALHGKFSLAFKRFTTSKAGDPYQTLPFLEELHKRHGLKAIYFWLLAATDHREDTNPYPIPAEQKGWIQRLNEQHQTGIHPSYESIDKEALIKEEADRLTEITGRRISRSRQHWLRFRLPQTYRALQLAGIMEDYTMGYADAVGWRAGTNRPYYWYDLEREQETGLRIHSFAAMEVTLKNYLNQNSSQAHKTIIEIAKGVKRYGGPFQLLWHNSSFVEEYGWAGWREMYARLVADLSAMQDQTDS